MKFSVNDLKAIWEITLAVRAYEKVEPERSKLLDWRRFFSKHTYDAVISGFLLILLIVGAVGWAVHSTRDPNPEIGKAANVSTSAKLDSTSAKGDAASTTTGPNAKGGSIAAADHQSRGKSSDQILQLVFGASVLGAGINIISRFYDIAQKRLGTVDAFISEILSIGRVFTSGNTIGGLIYCYDQVKAIEKQYEPNAPPLKNLTIRYDESLQRERYTANFDRNCPDLGPFSAEVVSNVTAFYTFLRASRDATGALALWDNENYPIDMRKNDIIIIVYYCLLMAIHGRLSLESLIEEKQSLKYAKDVFMTIELQSFLFLARTLPSEDPRLSPSHERKESYRKIIVERNLKNHEQLIAIIDRLKPS